MSRLIVILQCAAVRQRCSGVNCAHAFYSREGAFANLPADARYLTMDCGGCCGSSLPAKLENLAAKISKLGAEKDDVTVHLSSCIVSENHHRTPCPFRAHIRELVERKGFKVALGSYVSKKAEAKRKSGEYRPWS